MEIIAVIGSRNFDDFDLLEKTLIDYSPSLIVSGGAKGADSLAKKYAELYEIPLKEFLPDWDKYGKGAGVVRNKEIIKEADLVIVFWDGVSRGTKNGIELSRKFNKTIKIILYEDVPRIY